MLLSSKLSQFFSRNKRFIGGNWKSNNSLEDSVKIVQSNINPLKFNASNVGKNNSIQM